jgi:hypothetical protein
MIFAGISRSMMLWKTVLAAIAFPFGNIDLKRRCHQFDDGESWFLASLCVRLYIATLAASVSCATLAAKSPRAGIVIATNTPLFLGGAAPLAAQRMKATE